LYDRFESDLFAARWRMLVYLRMSRRNEVSAGPHVPDAKQNGAGKYGKAFAVPVCWRETLGATTAFS
jgi:hypothetical protein